MEAIAIRDQEEALQAGSKISDLMEAFLSGKSKKTLEAYRRDLKDFQEFTGAETPALTARLLLSRGPGRANATVFSYKSHLIERGLGPSTINQHLSALRSLVKMARAVGLVPWSLEVPSMKTEAYRDTRGPGAGAVPALLAQVGGSSPKAARDHAIIRLLYDLGLRRGEVVSLDLEDIDLERCTVSVMGKGRREKELLTLPEPTIAALTSWLEVRGMEPGPLFTNVDRAGKGQRLSGTSIYRNLKALGAAVGVRVTPHGLRHTAITEAVKLAQANGYGLEEVRDFSRHVDIKTLMVYRDRERNVQGQLAKLVASHVPEA